MRAQFLSNLFLLLLLNLVVKPFWLLGVDREVQNALGPADYGSYFSLLSFSILFSSILDLGISSYNNRNIAQHDFLIHKYFTKLLHIKGGLALVYMLLMLIAGLVLGYRGEMLYLLLWLSANQVLLSLILFLRSNLTALMLFKRDSIISVTDKLLLIGLCGGLLLYQSGAYLSLSSFVGAQSIAYLLTVLLAFGFLGGRISIKKIQLKISGYLAIIKESYPFAILVLLMAIYSRTDAIMLERLLPAPEGSIQSGIYAQGYRILDASSMIAYLFASLLLPMFAKMVKAREDVTALAATAMKLLGVFSIGVALLATVFSERIITVLYDNEVAQSIHVFEVLMFSLIPIASTYVFGTLLTAQGNLRFLNQMAITGVLVNLMLNAVLIPEYKVQGAVYATLFTQGLTAIIQIIAAYRYTSFRFVLWHWLVLGIFAGVVFVSCSWAAETLKGWNAVILSVVLIPVIALVLGILKPKAVGEILKSRSR